MIQIDVMEVLLKQLKIRGWRENGGYAIRDNPRVLERDGKRVAAVKPIKIDPFKLIQTEIDNFFRYLIDIINKNGIKIVFLAGGGTIPIPDFFLDYCRENGINILMVTNDNIDQYENWEL